LTAVCDSKHKLTYSHVGWPGSVHDSRVYASTPLVQHPDDFFEAHQYLLADSAYWLSTHTIAPYKKPAALLRDNKSFNWKLSHIRIDIEHSFGMLKSRFQSLTNLRCRIMDKAQYERAVQWIVAALVLHDLLISLTDGWLREDGFYEEDWEEEDAEEDFVDAREALSRAQHATGTARRECLKAQVLEQA
jgi:hypothetical protein